MKRSTSVTKVKNNLLQAGTSHYGPALDDIAAQAVDEYELHIKGVKSAFNGFIYEYNAADKA